MRVELLAAACLALAALPMRAEAPADFAAAFATAARRADPAFGGFSAERGRAFFLSTQGGDWSCASCHGEDPRAAGEHVVTGKRIEPLAPAANPARFTRPDKVKKWFDRNCNDVLERPCTAVEQGDLLAFLMSLGG